MRPGSRPLSSPHPQLTMGKEAVATRGKEPGKGPLVRRGFYRLGINKKLEPYNQVKH